MSNTAGWNEKEDVWHALHDTQRDSSTRIQRSCEQIQEPVVVVARAKAKDRGTWRALLLPSSVASSSFRLRLVVNQRS